MNKLLIIDDDEDISAMLFLLLRSKDFEVAVVTKSEDIFHKIKTYQPDIILLDVFLTGYDGRVICKQLKFHPDSKHIPVIMVSVSYTHLRAHETRHDIVCRLLLEKKKTASPPHATDDTASQTEARSKDQHPR